MHPRVEIGYLASALEQNSEIGSLKLVEKMAEMVIDFLLSLAQGQLDLTNQERVFDLEIDKNVSGRLVEFVLDPNDLKIVFSLENLVVDPIDVRLAPYTSASQ